MALSLWVSQAFFGKNFIRSMMGEQIALPDAAWRRLNTAWVLFFAVMGVLNLYVAYSFSTGAWVNFKLFGFTGLMIAFMVAQGLYLTRHAQPDAVAEPGDKSPGNAASNKLPG
jgi:intracellular septation protein